MLEHFIMGRTNIEENKSPKLDSIQVNHKNSIKIDHSQMKMKVTVRVCRYQELCDRHHQYIRCR